MFHALMAMTPEVSGESLYASLMLSAHLPWPNVQFLRYLIYGLATHVAPHQHRVRPMFLLKRANAERRLKMLDSIEKVDS